MEAAASHIEEKPLGRVFAEERERQGLTRAEAAQRLHMSAHQVEALESGDYTRLPKGTFLRGFVRNYAKALGLDPQACLSRLADAAPRAPAPGIVVPSQNIRFDPLGERLTNPYVKAGALAVVALALVFAALYWWLIVRADPPSVARKAPTEAAAGAARAQAVPQGVGPPQQIAAAPIAAPEPATNVPVDAPTEPVKSAPAKPEPVVRDAPKMEAPKAAARKATAAGGTRVVKMRFRGDSWVEIRDAQGRILLSKVNPKGSEAEVAGSPPFSVIVGNAHDVQLLYDDREFPLEPHTRVAVARFTLE